MTNDVRHILKKRRLAPKKKFGQNFLVHPQSAERIVEAASITSEDIILELGVGFGALTTLLAPKVRKVIGLEIDGGIVRYHQEEGKLPANVSIVHQDIMKADFSKLAQEAGGRLKIIANLPYSISNPLLFKLVEHQDSMAWAVLMLQKEVAQRLTARPATKEYGVLSVLLGSCADVSKLMELGPGHFHPKPKVDSQVVRITFQPVPERVAALPAHDRKLMKQVVNSAFQQRRKTLINGLHSADIIDGAKQDLALMLEQAGFDPAVRAEKLTMEDFVRLTNLLADRVDK